MDLSSLAALFQTGIGANYLLKGKNTKRTRNIADEIASLARAQYDTNSPQYQTALQGELDAGKQNLAETLAEMSRQNRKLASMGRTPLFDPERGGETKFRGMAQGYQDVQNQARGRARDSLARALQGMTGGYVVNRDFANMEDENRMRRAFGYAGMAGASPRIAGMFGYGQ